MSLPTSAAHRSPAIRRATIALLLVGALAAAFRQDERAHVRCDLVATVAPVPISAVSRACPDYFGDFQRACMQQVVVTHEPPFFCNPFLAGRCDDLVALRLRRVIANPHTLLVSRILLSHAHNRFTVDPPAPKA